MTQVAAADYLKSMKDCSIDYSADGSTWTDMCGYTSSIEPGGGERATGEAYTFCGDTALLGLGKKAPVEYTINVVYTESAAQPYQIIRDAYEDATDTYFRFSPNGGDAGEWMWTSDVGHVTSCPEPGGEASAADPVVIAFTFRTTKFTKSNVAS